jgi:putative heme-binding domain-containing protein
MRHLCLLWIVATGAGLVAATGTEPRPLVKHWVVEDFDAVIFVGLEGYRDFENGRRRFSDATCVKCHRFAGEGPSGAVAPDLVKVGETFTPRDLLAAILAPSEIIGMAHQVRHLELKDGRTIAGIVATATGTSRRIVPDPREPDRGETVPLAAVRAEKVSAISAMPAGLLDTFREEDILDLLAFLLSGGDRADPMFRK